MKTIILFLLLQAATARAQVPINAVLNTPTPQNAQFNVGTGTVRGTLTVGSLITSNLAVGSLSVTSINGNGAGLTNLSAASLTGTINTARITGPYTGITQVGTLTAGVWNASILSTQYGGTGQNFINVSTGDLVYFNGLGTMAALTPGAPQQLLQSNGFAAPSWTGTPTINGQNIQNLQVQYLSTGTLPSYVKVDDPSILAVSGSKVAGNISGFAVSVSSPIGIYQLAPGILPFAIPASSVTDSGVVAGTYGASNVVPQFTVGSDGRLRSVTNLIIPGVSTATARVDVDNNWQHAQTSISSWTIPSLKVTGTVTAGFFVGDGSGLFNIPTNIVSATGTATQLALFSGAHVLISSGAVTLVGTTLRVGNLNTPGPTTDVHLVVGNGPRAYNLNPSEDPVYLELASAAGAQAMMGFSKSGTQLMHIGLSPAGNWLFYDDDIGGGLGTALKYSIGTGHWTFGNPASGEGGVLTPTTLGIYGVETMFGTGALVAASSLNNGTLYFNSGIQHFQVSENAGSYNTLAVLPSLGFAGGIAYFPSNNSSSLTSDVNFTSASVTNAFTLVGASTGSIDVRLTAAESSIAALKLSTANLQTQLNADAVTFGQIANQFLSVAQSTSVIAFSTGVLQAQILGLFISTQSLQQQINNIVVSSASLQAQIFALDASTAAQQVQINSNIASIATLNSSTMSLQSQIAANVASIATLNASTMSLQAQVTANVASIATLNTSTMSLQSQVNLNSTNIAALSISTANNQVQINALSISTASNRSIINALSLSTAAEQVQINTLNASTVAIQASLSSLASSVLASTQAIASSTGTMQAQIAAIGVSTAAESAARIAGDASLQVQITALGASTNTLNAYMLAAFNAVGSSTNSLQSGLTFVGSSTAALQVQLTNVGASSAALQIQLNNVGASTAANQTQITALGLSTNTLNQVKASTGTNSDISSMTAVQNIGPLYFDNVGGRIAVGFSTFTYRLNVLGSIGVFNPSNQSQTVLVSSLGYITATSTVTALEFSGSGFGLTSVHHSSCTAIPNTTFTNTAFGAAISTITISNIRAGSLVRISFSGKAANNTSADGVVVSLLQDGAFTTVIGNASIAGFNNITPGVGGAVSTAENISFDVVLDTPALTAGSHSWAFAPAVITGGTGTLIKSATDNNRFCVTEEP